MFCSNCGKELLESAVFCIYCGTPVAPLAAVVERKPGKGYGIRSVFWATAGWLALLASFLIYLTAGRSPENLLDSLSVFLFWFSPLCVIAGIIYGLLGFNTEGGRYACNGLVLSGLYMLLVALLTAAIMLEEFWYWF